MSENAPLTDEPQLIEDPDKAHAMAIAGDKNRTKATSHRTAAKIPFFGGPGTAGELFHLERSESEDKLADQKEEETGRQYDEERQAAERVIGEKSVIMPTDWKHVIFPPAQSQEAKPVAGEKPKNPTKPEPEA